MMSRKADGCKHLFDSDCPTPGGRRGESGDLRLRESQPLLSTTRFWDCDVKASEHSDYTAGALVGREPGKSAETERLAIADGGEGDVSTRRCSLYLADGVAVGATTLIWGEESGNENAILQDPRRYPAAARLMIRGVRNSANDGVQAGRGKATTPPRELGKWERTDRGIISSWLL